MERSAAPPRRARPPGRMSAHADAPAVPRALTGSHRIDALDGVRGIAVALVVLFHVRLGPFGGGFVGVTVFFTLSGYLIAGRTIAEFGRTAGFFWRGFVERRVRRLLPASLVCLAGTLAATHLLGDVTQRSRLTGDTVAAVANVANWRLLLRGASYGELFRAPSPLNHYWSLAIEEQFYVLFPVAALLVLAIRPRMRSWAIGSLLIAAGAGSLAVAFTASRMDRFYYGTDARMFELLVGVALAFVVAWRRRYRGPGPRHLRRSAHRGRVAGAVGIGALGLIIAAGVVIPNGSTTFARGGAQAVAVATAVVIIVASRQSSALASACSVRPLVWLGKVSYAVYLYHWPIVVLSPKHLGPLRGASLAVAQIAATLVLAALSWAFVEQPILLGRVVPRRVSLVGGALGGAFLLIVVALALPSPSPGADVAANLRGGGTGVVVPSEHGSTPPGEAPMRIAVAGDSTAHVLVRSLLRYQSAHPGEVAVLDLSAIGCTVTRVATIRHYDGEAGQDMSGCATWPGAVAAGVSQFRPQVAVVMISIMEQADQRIATSGTWHNVLEADWRERQRSEFELLADELSAGKAPVMWADVPYMKFQDQLPWISDAPERTDALNALLRRVDAERPAVEMIDYASQVDAQDHSVDTTVRPDGIHLADSAIDRIVERWLLPLLRQRVH